jgi:hypothetical protein
MTTQNTKTNSIRSAILTVIISAVSSFLCVFLAFGLNRGAIESDQLDKKFEERPKYDYVDGRYKQAIEYCDKENDAQDINHSTEIQAIRKALDDQNYYLKMIIEKQFNEKTLTAK